MKRFFGLFLCAIGIHSFRERKNGKATERVCMRPGCDVKVKLYRLEDGEFAIWMRKKVPIGRHTFVKTEKN